MYCIVAGAYEIGVTSPNQTPDEPATSDGVYYFNMAKRFIDTGILKHHFTRGLEAPLKLLLLHLFTDCNNAGMWQVDFEIAEIIIGHKIDRKKAEKAFENKVVKLKDGAIWFIPDFIDFQYGKLQEKNPAHKNIIALLLKENLIDSDYNLKVLPSTFGVPSKGTMDMDKEKEKEKVMEKEKESEPKKAEKRNLNFGTLQESFSEKWDQWIRFKKEQHKQTFKSQESEQVAVNHLIKISGGDFLVAEQVIDQSIGQLWKGLFELKEENHKNGKSNTVTSGKKIGRIPEDNVNEFLNRGRIAPFTGEGTY